MSGVETCALSPCARIPAPSSSILQTCLTTEPAKPRREDDFLPLSRSLSPPPPPPEATEATQSSSLSTRLGIRGGPASCSTPRRTGADHLPHLGFVGESQHREDGRQGDAHVWHELKHCGGERPPGAGSAGGGRGGRPSRSPLPGIEPGDTFEPLGPQEMVWKSVWGQKRELEAGEGGDKTREAGRGGRREGRRTRRGRGSGQGGRERQAWEGEKRETWRRRDSRTE